MTQQQSGFGPDKIADNDNRKFRPSAPAAVEPVQPQKESLGARWRNLQPTKTTLFWFCVGAVVLTMLVGFNWGGWMRGSTAQRMADVSASNAVTERLATICVAQFNLDPTKDQKLQELQAASSYKRAEYVAAQGWATVAGEEKPDSKVADACAKQLLALNP